MAINRALYSFAPTHISLHADPCKHEPAGHHIYNRAARLSEYAVRLMMTHTELALSVHQKLNQFHASPLKPLQTEVRTNALNVAEKLSGV